MAVGLNSHKKTMLSLLVAAVATVSGIHSTSAAIDGNWAVDGPGNWSNAANWTSNPISPGGAGATVGLTANISASRTVTVDTTSQTVGTLNTGDADATSSYTLAASGGASLIFDNGASDAALNQLSTSNGDTISAPIVLNSSLDINNASAAKALAITGGVSAGTAGVKTITNGGTGGGVVNFLTGASSDGAGSLAFVQNSSSSELTFAGTQNYSGGVTVNAGTVWDKSTTGLGTGTVTLGAASGTAAATLLVSTGSNSSLTVTNSILVRPGSSGPLTLQNNNTSSNSQVTLNGAITLNNNLTLRSAVTGSGSLTLGGNISGTQPATITAIPGVATITISGSVGANVTSIIQNSAGTLMISGTSPAFTGSLQVEQGTLVIGQLSQGTADVAYVSSGAILQKSNAGGSSTGRSAVAGLMDGTGGGGTVTRSTGGGTRPLEIGGTGTYTFSGVIQDNTAADPFLLIKTGTGSQTLSGANTYTGGTIILNGTLKLDGNNGTLAATGALAMQGGVFSYDNTNSANIAKSQGLGALTFSAGGSTIGSVLGNASSATLTFNSLTAPGIGATGNFVVTGGTDGVTNSIVPTGATAGFQNQGLFYNGADYAFIDSTGGFLRAATYGTDSGFANQASAGAALTTGTHNLVTSSISPQATESVNTIKFDGTGAVDLTLDTDATLTLSNGGLLRAGGGSTTISGSGAANITTGSGVEYVFRTDTASDSLTINTPISSVGTNTLVKDGAGMLSLGAANLYTGTTYVDGGILSISSNANLGAPATGAALNLNNGTLQATATFGLFNGAAGTNDRKVVIFNNGTFDVTGANTLAITGVVSDDWTAVSNSSFHKGSLTKTGTGTLTLSAANTYQGSTVITGGTLLVNGSLASSDVSVNNSGTLGGSGVITGPVSVNPGGTLAPGNSPGILTVGGLAMVSGSSLNVELNGLTAGTQYDQVVVTAGTPTLGSATLNVTSTGYTPGTSDEFVILNNLTSNAIGGTFAGLAQGADAATIDGQNFNITYTGDASTMALTGGNDVILYEAPSSVPEPASLALLGLGAVALLRRRA